MTFFSSRKMRSLMGPQSSFGLWQPTDYPELGLAQALVLYFGALVFRFQVGCASRALKKVKDSTRRRIRRCRPTQFQFHFLSSVSQVSSSVFPSTVSLPLEAVTSVDSTKLLFELVKDLLLKPKHCLEVPCLFETFTYFFVDQKRLTYSGNSFESMFWLALFRHLFFVPQIPIEAPIILDSVCLLFLELGKVYDGSSLRKNSIPSPGNGFEPRSILAPLSSLVSPYKHARKSLQSYYSVRVSLLAKSFDAKSSHYLLKTPRLPDTAPRLFPGTQIKFKVPQLKGVPETPPITSTSFGNSYLGRSSKAYDVGRTFKAPLLEPLRCNTTREFPSSNNHRQRRTSRLSPPKSSSCNTFVPARSVEFFRVQDQLSEVPFLLKDKRDKSILDSTLFDLAPENVVKSNLLPFNIEISLPGYGPNLDETFNLEKDIHFLPKFSSKSTKTPGCRKYNDEFNKEVPRINNTKDNAGDDSEYKLILLSVDENIELGKLVSNFDKLRTLLSTCKTNSGTTRCNISFDIDIEEFRRNIFKLQSCVISLSDEPLEASALVLDSGSTLNETNSPLNEEREVQAKTDIKCEDKEDEDSYAAQKAFYDYINHRDEVVNEERGDEDSDLGEYPSSSSSDFDYEEAERKMNEEFRKKLMLRTATEYKLSKKYGPGLIPKSVISIDVPMTSRDRWEVRKNDVVFEKRQLKANEDLELKEGRKVQFAEEVLSCTYKKTETIELIGRNELPPAFRHGPTKSILKQRPGDNKEQLPVTSMYNMMIGNTSFSKIFLKEVKLDEVEKDQDTSILDEE